MINVGDTVIMNDKYPVSEKYQGKEWLVKSEPFNICGTECVKLEGFTGCYALNGLTKVVK